MIEIVEGVGVGSGKSAFVCSRIARHIARGGTVVASDKFNVQWLRPWGPFPEDVAAERVKSFGSYWPKVEGMKEYIEDEYGVVPEEDQWRTFPAAHIARFMEHTPQGTDDCPVLLVLDEAQDGLGVADATDQAARKAKADLFAWLCQSRHDNNDLIFITQNAMNIDVKIRRIATYIVRVRNMVTFSIGGMRTPWWKKFCVNINDAQNLKTRIERVWLNHCPRLFSSYISKSQKGAHARAGVVGRKKLQRVQKKSNAMKTLAIMFLACLCALGVAIYKIAFQNPFGGGAAVAVQSSSSGTIPDARASSAKSGEPAKPLWTTHLEDFRGGDGRTFLHTSEGQYYAGELSGKGYVESVRGHSARLKTPEGSLAFIVTRNGLPPPQAPAVEKQDLQEPKPAQVATVQEPVKVTRIEAIRGGYPAHMVKDDEAPKEQPAPVSSTGTARTTSERAVLQPKTEAKGGLIAVRKIR